MKLTNFLTQPSSPLTLTQCLIYTRSSCLPVAIACQAALIICRRHLSEEIVDQRHLSAEIIV